MASGKVSVLSGGWDSLCNFCLRSAWPWPSGAVRIVVEGGDTLFVAPPPPVACLLDPLSGYVPTPVPAGAVNTCSHQSSS